MASRLKSRQIINYSITNSTETDINMILAKLDGIIKIQIITNDTLTTHNNKIIELEKISKEKDIIIQNLEFKINVLEQNKREQCNEISGVKMKILNL